MMSEGYRYTRQHHHHHTPSFEESHYAIPAAVASSSSQVYPDSNGYQLHQALPAESASYANYSPTLSARDRHTPSSSAIQDDFIRSSSFTHQTPPPPPPPQIQSETSTSTLRMSNSLSRPLTAEESERLSQLEKLKFFLITAPSKWDNEDEEASMSNDNNKLVTNSADAKYTARAHQLGHHPESANHPQLNRFLLPTQEYVSCVLWAGLYHITGTDIVRALVFRFEAFGRPVKNMKKFEEGVFSDLRNLKPGTDASLEEPKSPFLDLLFKYQCIRTQKKQKVFYWFSVPHDRLFLDALERDLKREKQGQEATTVITGEPALSFVYDSKKSLYEQFSKMAGGLAGEGELEAAVRRANEVADSIQGPSSAASSTETPLDRNKIFSMFSLADGADKDYKQRTGKKASKSRTHPSSLAAPETDEDAHLATPPPQVAVTSHPFGVSMKEKVVAYRCPLLTCQRLFRTSDELYAHHRSHILQRPHGCHFCDRRFVHQSSLALHARSHTEPGFEAQDVALEDDSIDLQVCQIQVDAHIMEEAEPVTPDALFGISPVAWAQKNFRHSFTAPPTSFVGLLRDISPEGPYRSATIAPPHQEQQDPFDNSPFSVPYTGSIANTNARRYRSMTPSIFPRNDVIRRPTSVAAGTSSQPSTRGYHPYASVVPRPMSVQPSSSGFGPPPQHRSAALQQQMRQLLNIERPTSMPPMYGNSLASVGAPGFDAFSEPTSFDSTSFPSGPGYYPDTNNAGYSSSSFYE